MMPPGGRHPMPFVLIVAVAVLTGNSLVCNDSCVCDWYPGSCSSPSILLAGRSITGQVTPAWFASVPSLSAYTALYLSANSITSVDPAAFSALTALRLLDLSVNQLSGLEADTFRFNTRLTNLNLVVNQLTVLQSGIFSSLTQLQILNVARNSLTWTPAGSLSGPTSFLNYLTLAPFLMAAMDPDAFSMLTALQMLSMGSNHFTALPSLSALTQLRQLDLTDNQLQSIPAGMFLYNTRLTWLSISSSTMTAIDSGAFSTLSRLTYLQMDTLQVTSIPARLLSSLTTLTSMTMYNLPLVNALDRNLFQSLVSFSSSSELDVQTGMTALKCVPLPPPVNISTYRTGGKPTCPAAVTTSIPTLAAPVQTPVQTGAPTETPRTSSLTNLIPIAVGVGIAGVVVLVFVIGYLLRGYSGLQSPIVFLPVYPPRPGPTMMAVSPFQQTAPAHNPWETRPVSVTLEHSGKPAVDQSSRNDQAATLTSDNANATVGGTDSFMTLPITRREPAFDLPKHQPRQTASGEPTFRAPSHG